MRDSFVDIARLSETDHAATPDPYTKAMGHAYWEDKDLAAAISIGTAGWRRPGAPGHDRQRDAGDLERPGPVTVS